MRRVFAHPGAVRGCLVIGALVVSLGAVLSAQSQGLRVVPLVRDGRVFVTFELHDAFTSDLRAAIHSGLKTSFTYTVDLRLDARFGFDRTIATATVTNTVKYNNLHRTYALEQSLDGRVEKARTVDANADPEAETLVRNWLTYLDKQPLFRTDRLQANREYYVRVSASARPSNGSLLWPFGSGTSAQTKFTFIR